MITSSAGMTKGVNAVTADNFFVVAVKGIQIIIGLGAMLSRTVSPAFAVVFSGMTTPPVTFLTVIL